MKIGPALRGSKFQNHFFSLLRPIQIPHDSLIQIPCEKLCLQSEFHCLKLKRTTSNKKKNSLEKALFKNWGFFGRFFAFFQLKNKILKKENMVSHLISYKESESGLRF